MKQILITSILSFLALNLSFSQVYVKMQEENGIHKIPCIVNGLKLQFIFDTGASNVCISLSEALFMLKNGYLNESDISGSSYAQIANGEIVENTTVILREIDIAGIKLKNIKAVIIHELSAPLLLGNSAINQFGKYSIEGDVLIINSKEKSDTIPSSTVNSHGKIVNDYCNCIDYKNSYWDTEEGENELMYYLPKCAETGTNEAQFQLGLKFYTGLIYQSDSKDVSKAYKWFKISAETGNTNAQYYLGRLYELGEGVKSDNEQALYWYKVSAENGNPDAQFELGFIFEKDKNFEDAKYWYKKSFTKDARAAFRLGQMYYYGKGIAIDYELAMSYYSKIDLISFQSIKDTSVINYIELMANQGDSFAQFMLWKQYWFSDKEQSVLWLEKSAENGYPEAQNILGELYYMGGEFYHTPYTIIKDYKKAEYWWVQSASQGNVMAQTNLGCIYSENDILHTISYLYSSNSGGVKIPVDYEKAFFWLDKASKNGNNHAKSVLAWMYANGFGTNKELVQCFKLTKEIAEHGDLNAQLNLGYMYEFGDGTNENMEQAIYWYKMAAINGNIEAQKVLGNNYLFYKQDYREAFFWYEKAAKQGDDEAQFAVGNMYSNGRGVLTNDKQAVLWYRKAAFQENKEAQYNLGLMYLGGFGVERSKKEAALWIKKSYDNGLEKARDVWEEYELWKY